ncbi:ABC-type cobalamin/Fe3+-siderophore transport system, ATPase component [Salinarchaeum sp. Harcht-Bsk1]|uniref:ATP-binding cassette domain-containing protein n=1 Tax=Salinarchaeum sp. Harcht-Bsk1 TaxID=1333523 RepID=UPI0003424960|nr:ATP-binding cassette domain-containing protein [Salinarchaeum sp. Harcht-Bsk1]AGN00767.1 ABC-type cobalamin/Fe3+-siderophore transport system, ATPase component [Salinarchaeum sp. Harcht-Bsk1]
MTGEEVSTASESDGPPGIQANDVVASFGAESVLEDVSATVARGELVGLVGPNGAGKTTFLRTISGALAPDDGEIRVVGDSIAALSSAAASRRIAVVPQTTHLSFAFSVRELVEMGRHPHRSRFDPPSREDRALVEAAMERTDTARFADRSIEDVSGGERQRVLLARAIAQDAPVLLLDEPTASLDLHHAVETMAMVRDLVDEDDAAALAAIHDLELAARFCDRILVLAGGAIVAAGPPEDVLEADILEAAFDARIAVEHSPLDGGVTVRALADPELDRRVHVVGGGERAASALGRLGEAGASLSLGPVPAGDRAVSTAEAVDAEPVTVPPFAPADGGAIERALDLAAEADAVVLAATDLPEAWRRCVTGTDTPLVAVGEGPVPVEGALRTDPDSLPGTIEAVARRSADTAKESRNRRALADATVADGGVDVDVDGVPDGDADEETNLDADQETDVGVDGETDGDVDE